jgi:uracil-DNA glycosylase
MMSPGLPLLGKAVQDIQDCSSCKYCTYPKPILYKNLHPNPFLFVLECPDEVEEALNEPLTGPAGKLFVDIVSLILPPEKWYAANSLVCAPRVNNELVTPSIIDTLRCSHNLLSLIEVLKPRHIITLGSVAERLVNKFRIAHTSLVHPSSIIRSGGIRSVTGVRFRLQLEKVAKQYA